MLPRELPLRESVLLTATLNALGAGLLTAAEAEQAIRTDGRPHHLADPDSLLGLDPLHGTPLRVALARVELALPGARWALLAVRPGRLGGLRATGTPLRDALEVGLVVLPLAAGPGWLARPVGAAMQWQLITAAVADPPMSAAEAGRELAETVLRLGRLLPAVQPGRRRPPALERAPRLGVGYSPQAQQRFDSAWRLYHSALAGLSTLDTLPSAFEQQARSRALEELAEVAMTALCSVLTWPR